MTKDKLTVNTPVTVEIDLQKFLHATVGYDLDEDIPETLSGEIVRQAALFLASRMESEVTKRVQPLIDAKVEELITKLLTEEYQPMTTYGSPTGEKTSLKAEIAKSAETALKNGMKIGHQDGYGRTEGTGGLRKYIAEVVDKELKGDLKKALDEAKAAVHDRVKDNAAAVIADTLTRTAVR